MRLVLLSGLNTPVLICAVASGTPLPGAPGGRALPGFVAVKLRCEFRNALLPFAAVHLHSIDAFCVGRWQNRP